MRLKRGAWEGAQPRTYILNVMRLHGVSVQKDQGDLPDFYMTVDSDGDPRVMYIPNPVPSEIVVSIFRYFAHQGVTLEELFRLGEFKKGKR